jgi:hypothetical protein
MERFTALSRGAQLMLVAGVLLLIDTFLPWQDVGDEVGDIAEAFGVDTSFTAWHGFWGVMLGLLTIVLIAWLLFRMLGNDMRLPVSETMVAAGLGLLIVLFALVKVLVDDEFRTAWAWIGLVLAALVAIGAWMQVQEGGGMDALKAEASGMGSSSAGAAAAPPPPADMPAETPPAAPAEPPAAAPPPAEPPAAEPPPAPHAPPAAPAQPAQPTEPMQPSAPEPSSEPAAPADEPEEERPA